MNVVICDQNGGRLCEVSSDSQTAAEKQFLGVQFGSPRDWRLRKNRQWGVDVVLVMLGSLLYQAAVYNAKTDEAEKAIEAAKIFAKSFANQLAPADGRLPAFRFPPAKVAVDPLPIIQGLLRHDAN